MISIYIENIKNETIEIDGVKHEIVELKVRGKEKYLTQLFNDIQDEFDLAHDDWDKSLSMLTMTFDKKPREQTANLIKRFTKDYIKYDLGLDV